MKYCLNDKAKHTIKKALRETWEEILMPFFAVMLLILIVFSAISIMFSFAYIFVNKTEMEISDIVIGRYGLFLDGIIIGLVLYWFFKNIEKCKGTQ